MGLDETLRGDAYGQLTPEGQQLWNEYNNLLNANKNIPMRNMNLRSGAQIQIPDIGPALKNRLLSGTLKGMRNTGLGDRAKPQPGYLSQLAPFFIAAGMGGGKGKGQDEGTSAFWDYIKKMFGGGGSGEGYEASDATGEDWWSGLIDSSDSSDTSWVDGLSDIDWGDWGY